MTQRGKGRPRDGEALWRSLQRKGTRIRQRLEAGGIYTDVPSGRSGKSPGRPRFGREHLTGAVWEIAGTVAGPCISVSHWAGGVRTMATLYPTIQIALDAELYNAEPDKREEL